MGLTKQYLAFRPTDTFNIIASGRANINFAVYNKIEGRYAVSAAAEDAILWDLRLGERVKTLRRNKQEVSALRVSPDHIHVALGYADGVVEIFDLSTSRSTCSLALHKSAISVLRYDETGLRLVCGSLDTELVIVDLVEQAGCNRLIGHNAPITDAHFLERLGIEQSIVVSSSKDTQIKFWNLETQFCFKTIVDNRTEVWGLSIVGSLLIAGSSESGMNVYRLKKRFADEQKVLETAIEGLSINDEDAISPLTVTKCGVIQRAGKGRTINLVSDPTERVICCHGTNKLIESFYICTIDEAKQRLAKRLKKSRKSENGSKMQEEEVLTDVSLSDEIRRLEAIKVKEKIKSIDILLGGKDELRVLINLANNCLQLYSLSVNFKKLSRTSESCSAVKCLTTLARLGHQSDVRAVCFSSDSLAIGTGSAKSFKLWNRESRQCLRTVATEYILSATFVPGDRYVLLGMKSGKILIIDVGIGDVIEEISAHESEVWSIALLPDQKGCVTGSGDMTVKLWIFKLVDNPLENEDNMKSIGKALSLLHKNTLKLEDTVLCVRVSWDIKYLAVGLLDSTVKIFFLDTFKFYLSLYGHKLPVLCMDISYDSALIATGSADRNVKIWGLDFGDCHHSIFAHDDSVMSLQFINNTHMFFTCGKDGKIKQWDGDSFDKILTLPGHIGEAYALSVSPDGRYLVTCGSDQTLRLFQRTDEPIVLQDVQEEEREELENEQLASGQDSSVPMLPGLKLASRKTVGAEKAAESIIECLEICKEVDSKVVDSNPDLHPLMRALGVQNVHDFVFTVITRIRASDLEESLLLVPFTNVCELLERLPAIIMKRSDEIEILCKITIFLFKVHMKPITGTKLLKTLIDKIVKLLQSDVYFLRNVIGANLHGLALCQREFESRDGMDLFYEASQDRKTREKKRREATKRLHLQLH